MLLINHGGPAKVQADGQTAMLVQLHGVNVLLMY